MFFRILVGVPSIGKTATAISLAMEGYLWFILLRAIGYIVIPISAASDLESPKGQVINPALSLKSTCVLQTLMSKQVHSVCTVKILFDGNVNSIPLCFVTFNVNLDKVDGSPNMSVNIVKILRKRIPLKQVSCVLLEVSSSPSLFCLARLENCSRRRIYMKTVTIWFRLRIRLNWTDKNGSMCITFPTTKREHVFPKNSRAKNDLKSKSSLERKSTKTRRKRSANNTTTTTSSTISTGNSLCPSIDPVLYWVSLTLGFISLTLLCFTICRAPRAIDRAVSENGRCPSRRLFSRGTSEKRVSKGTSLEGNAESLTGKDDDENSFFEIIAVYDTLHDGHGNTDLPCSNDSLNQDVDAVATPTKFQKNVTDEVSLDVHYGYVNSTDCALATHLEYLNENPTDLNADNRKSYQIQNQGNPIIEMQEISYVNENVFENDQDNVQDINEFYF